MPEEEKSALHKSAFEKFKTKIMAISHKQNQVFSNIMRRIDDRKIEETRSRINNHQDDDSN